MTDRVLVVDHRDSFVFVLAEQFAKLGVALETYRCDILVDELERRIAAFDPHLVVLSPGPGHPRDAATTLGWLRRDPSVPILGVCLGHQALALADGGSVDRAPAPVHGRGDVIRFGDDPLTQGLRSPFQAARYHSLVVTEMPPTLRAIAHTDDDDHVVMAMRHVDRPRIGLQFHPESFLTPGGGELLARILDEARAHRRE